MNKILEPLSLCITGVLFVLIWAWLSLANIDYQPDSYLFGLQTAGWFILGIPFLIGFGLVAMMPFTFLARKFNRVAGWIAVLAIGGFIVGNEFVAALPKSHVSRTLGIELPDDVTISRFNVMDTFNDGTRTFGVISGSPELIEQIANANNLSLEESSLQILKSYREGETLPDRAKAYCNELMTVYFAPNANTIYFFKRSSLPRP